MELSDFAALPQNVTRDDGFDDFIPVACFPERRALRGLNGLPDDADVEAESLAWATALAGETEEFLVTFKFTSNQFKVVRRLNGAMESAIYNGQTRQPDMWPWPRASTRTAALELGDCHTL